MSTINKTLAQELVINEGRHKKDKIAYCVVRYQNRTKYDLPNVDLYDPEAPINCFDYAVFYDQARYLNFLEAETVGGVDILWGSRKFHKEDEEARLKEESDELTYEFFDPLDFETKGTNSTRSPRRK